MTAVLLRRLLRLLVVCFGISLITFLLLLCCCISQGILWR